MQTLELKIPPVAQLVLFAAAMWGTTLLAAPMSLPLVGRIAAGVLLCFFGAAICLAGVAAFRREKTTVNPTKPARASALVSNGIYGITRNPMYLGFLLMLLGLAAYLANGVSLIGPVAFVLYMNRFQITPEERALTKIFGQTFIDYKSRVRRWL